MPVCNHENGNFLFFEAFSSWLKIGNFKLRQSNWLCQYRADHVSGTHDADPASRREASHRAYHVPGTRDADHASRREASHRADLWDSRY